MCNLNWLNICSSWYIWSLNNLIRNRLVLNNTSYKLLNFLYRSHASGLFVMILSSQHCAELHRPEVKHFVSRPLGFHRHLRTDGRGPAQCQVKLILNFCWERLSLSSLLQLLKSLLLCSFTVEITDTDTELFQLGQFGHMRSFSTEDTVEIMIVFHPQ